jgi:hypothetical protein
MKGPSHDGLRKIGDRCGRAHGRARNVARAFLGVSPAAGTPVCKGRPLAADGRVLAVAGIDPGLVRQPVEELRLDVA